MRCNVSLMGRWYSQGDRKLSALLLCSSEGDGERGLNPLHLVDKLDPELVMINCRERETERNRKSLRWRNHPTQFVLCISLCFANLM